MSRYKVIEGSQSGHCCFEFTVVDTTKERFPYMDDDHPMKGKEHEAVCETFDRPEANMIAEALNMRDEAPLEEIKDG